MLLDAWMVFSTRSANKKVCKTGVNPKNIFQRVKNSNECPILSHFIILASTSFFEQNNDQSHISLPSSLQAQSSDDEDKDEVTLGTNNNDDVEVSRNVVSKCNNNQM
jgi:hypothetical protein